MEAPLPLAKRAPWLMPALPLLLAGLAAGHVAERAHDLRLAAGLHLAALVCTLASVACCKLGLWHLAAHQARRPGRRALGWGLKLALLATALALGWCLATQQRAAQAAEMGRLALGQDPLPAVQAEVVDAGEGLLLHGTLGGGSAVQVQAVLDSNPAVRWVRLDSPGGRLLEAEAIAEQVQRRGLATHVDGLCASACTLVLLAGRSRSAAPTAQIGFHRPQFAGIDAQDLGDTPALLAAYRQAGVGDDFIEQVRRTPSSALWYPARAALLRNGVLTR